MILYTVVLITSGDLSVSQTRFSLGAPGSRMFSAVQDDRFPSANITHTLTPSKTDINGRLIYPV